jgi:heat shock protein HspQ
MNKKRWIAEGCKVEGKRTALSFPFKFLLSRYHYILALFLLTVPHIGAAETKVLPLSIMGIRLEMQREDAHRLLEKIGRLQREERKRQEVWELRDARFSHLLIGFDEESRVRYVTAVAREGSRVPYSEVGDLKRARAVEVVNNYKYVWEAKPRRNSPAYLVIARGRDPKYLSYYALKKIGETDDDD